MAKGAHGRRRHMPEASEELNASGIAMIFGRGSGGGAAREGRRDAARAGVDVTRLAPPRRRRQQPDRSGHAPAYRGRSSIIPKEAAAAPTCVCRRTGISKVTAIFLLLCYIGRASCVKTSQLLIAKGMQKGVELLDALDTENSSLNVLLSEGIQDVMVPGTRWCGAGDVATSYDDVGRFKEIDVCCREHDSCPDSISVGESKHGLKNLGFYTWSHCDCDWKFYECLKNVGNTAADVVGFGYFTVLGSKCFREDHPIVSCKKCKFTTLTYKKRNRKKCLEYNLDEGKPKEYQWFDNPLYYD